MNRKRRGNKFLKKAFVVFATVLSISTIFTLQFNSIESSLNIEVQTIEEEIEELKAYRDGLNTARSEKISFENIEGVAKKNGYSLNYATTQVAAKTE